MNYPCRDCEDQEIDFISETYEPEYEDLETWEYESPRSSRPYIKWIQHSLNRIIRARLKVDGIMGPKTRAAVRKFQSGRGLKVDGIVGPQTEAALLRAGAGPVPGGKVIDMPPEIIVGRNCTIVDKFDFDGDRLKPPHKKIINRIAHQIVTSYSTPRPIRTVYVEGHTDPVGSDAYNIALSKRRAMRVRVELINAINRLRRGLSSRVLILVKSFGESRPISSVNARNRRVEVCLSTKALRTKPKPVPRPQPHPIPRPTPRPNIPKQQGCNRAEYSRRVDQCVADAKTCVTSASAQLAKDLLKCRGNPFCNVTASAKYYNRLRKCRDAIMPCDQAAKRATGC